MISSHLSTMFQVIDQYTIQSLPKGHQGSCCSGLFGSGKGRTNITNMYSVTQTDMPNQIGKQCYIYMQWKTNGQTNQVKVRLKTMLINGRRSMFMCCQWKTKSIMLVCTPSLLPWSILDNTLHNTMCNKSLVFLPSV